MSEEIVQIALDLSHVFELLSNKKNDILNIDYSNDSNSYPTVRAVKNYVDNAVLNVTDLQTMINSKASTTDLINGLQNIGAYTIHTVYNVSGNASAYDISSGLLYTQQSPVFFLVKNNIGDNNANATLKYYPNGDNITIIDTFSNNHTASPIQQGVWKKDTWALFFCVGNNTVELRSVFYDSNYIDERNFDLSELELIDSTHSLASTANWTGTSTRLTSLTKGTRILYRLTYVPTARGQGGAGLSIQFTDNTHSGYKPIRFADGTQAYNKWFLNSIAKNDVLLLEYNGTNWVLLDFFAIGDRPNVARTGSYNDLSDKPTIPSASTSLPSADTASGSVGDGTTWARSNHTHPKSSLYAEVDHTHSEYVNPIIIDNLITDDATKVLSAKQGKVLGDLIGDAISYINGVLSSFNITLVDNNNDNVEDVDVRVITDPTGKATLETNSRISLSIGKTGYFDTTVDFYMDNDVAKTVRLIPQTIDDTDLHIFALDEEGDYGTCTVYIYDENWNPVVNGETVNGELVVSTLENNNKYYISASGSYSADYIDAEYTHGVDNNVFVGKFWSQKSYTKTTLRVLNSDGTPYVGKVYLREVGYIYYLTDNNGEFNFTKNSTQYVINGNGETITEIVDIANNSLNKLIIIDNDGWHPIDFRFIVDNEVYEYKLKSDEPLTTMTIYDESTVTEDEDGIKDFTNATVLSNYSIEVCETIYTSNANGQIQIKATQNKKYTIWYGQYNQKEIYAVNGEFLEKYNDYNDNVHYYPPIIRNEIMQND